MKLRPSLQNPRKTRPKPVPVCYEISIAGNSDADLAFVTWAQNHRCDLAKDELYHCQELHA